MQSQVLVVCKQDRTLVSLDPLSLDVRWRAALSAIGHEVVASRDGDLGFVPLYGTGGVGGPGRSGNGIDVICLASGAGRGTIPLPRRSRPHHAGWSGADRLLVTAEGIESVLSVDVAAAMRLTGNQRQERVVARALQTAHLQSHMLAVAPDGSRVYTADVHPGAITELEATTGRRRSLPLADRVNRTSLSPDGATAYIADQVEPRLAVVDVHSMTLDRWITLPDIGFGTATLGAGRLIVALRQAGRLALLEIASGNVLRTVSVPDGPQQVVLASDRRLAYTTCSPADVVVAVDLYTMRVVAQGSPGWEPDGLALVRDVDATACTARRCCGR